MGREGREVYIDVIQMCLIHEAACSTSCNNSGSCVTYNYITVPAPTSAEGELSQRTNSTGAKLYLDIDIWLPN